MTDSNRRCDCKGKDNECPKCHGMGYVEPNVKPPVYQASLGDVVRDPNGSFYGVSSGCSRTIPKRYENS